MPADVPTSAAVIDRHLGARLRHLRKERGVSLQDCGDILSVSYQQIQKYETGVNRLSIVSLVRLARAFGIPPASFYEGLDAASSLSDPDADRHSPDDGYPLPNLHLTQSITRLSPLNRHLLNELILAIEQNQLRRSADRSFQSPTPPPATKQDP